MLDIQSQGGKLILMANTHQLCRIRLRHTNDDVFMKSIDDYDRVWVSYDSFLVMPAKDAVAEANRLLELWPSWIDEEEDGIWTDLVIECFPFGPNDLTCVWRITDNELKSPNSMETRV